MSKAEVVSDITPGWVAMTEAELIERHIDPNPHDRGLAEARLKESGVSVWALIGAFPAANNEPAQVAADYGVSWEAMEAALAFYRRYHKFIDARLLLNGSRNA